MEYIIRTTKAAPGVDPALDCLARAAALGKPIISVEAVADAARNAGATFSEFVELMMEVKSQGILKKPKRAKLSVVVAVDNQPDDPMPPAAAFTLRYSDLSHRKVGWAMQSGARRKHGVSVDDKMTHDRLRRTIAKLHGITEPSAVRRVQVVLPPHIQSVTWLSGSYTLENRVGETLEDPGYYWKFLLRPLCELPSDWKRPLDYADDDEVPPAYVGSYSAYNSPRNQATLWFRGLGLPMKALTSIAEYYWEKPINIHLTIRNYTTGPPTPVTNRTFPPWFSSGSMDIYEYHTDIAVLNATECNTWRDIMDAAENSRVADVVEIVYHWGCVGHNDYFEEPVRLDPGDTLPPSLNHQTLVATFRFGLTRREECVANLAATVAFTAVN